MYRYSIPTRTGLPRRRARIAPPFPGLRIVDMDETNPGAPPPATPRTAAEPPRVLILITVSMCTMLYALTVTIVNVILPQLQGALSATPEQVSWVVTLNVIATAVATPMTGWLVARFGQRNVVLWSVMAFTVSSLLCATAENLAPLLVYRIGQGIFGAPLVPLSQAIIIATYPPERRAAAQACSAWRW